MAEAEFEIPEAQAFDDGSSDRLTDMRYAGVGTLADVMGVEEAKAYFEERERTRQVLRRLILRDWRPVVYPISHRPFPGTRPNHD